jgi:hypothetical protein
MELRVWNVNHFDPMRSVPGGIRTPNLLIRSLISFPSFNEAYEEKCVVSRSKRLK